MSFPRYPKYKESGIEWLGMVPEHWNVKRARTLGEFSSSGIDKKSVDGEQAVQMFNYLDVYKSVNKVLQFSTGLMWTTAPFDKVAEHAVRNGDILLTPSSETEDDIGHAARVTAVPPNVVYSYHLLRFRTSKLTDSTFLTYCFNASSIRSYFESVCTGTTRMVLGREDFKNAPFACPPLVEQSAISDFLDRETAKIDRLVTEQQRLMELLKEKRQAVISHAVTKGLNPNAPMKPSGIEWLGDVPAHWQMKRIKHLTRSIEQGWSPQCESFPAESENEWGVLKVGCVNGGVFNSTENKLLPDELEPISSLAVSRYDLLISRANTRELVGSAAVAKRDYPNLMLCDKLYRLRFFAAVASPHFVSHYLRSSVVRGQIELGATGASASMVNIPQSVIMELVIAVPPIDEQNRILTFLELEISKIDALTTEAQHAIDLLQERRTALISAAVTGQIDVRRQTNK